MKWIIDRIENDIAVCELENGTFIDLNINALPENVSEGDVITINIDKNETKSKKEKIDKLMNDLFK
ncbi:MAG: DUF3006 domain-containing protein [Eubacterium sp.]|nr:DUF3006 domain-containing protein [Eubacterium sp.]MDE6155220.1 DUF3006 domain-containing protein [Eubacterium sp.]MDE6766964.1 DUF3006 domain-containing protein [Eubacterium sp.]